MPFFLGENTLGVLFPVSKHMRGGAENNEASPRHLPTSFQENTTHTPSSVRRGWLWKLTLWIKIWSWESGLLKLFSVSHGPDANSREIFLFFCAICAHLCTNSSKICTKGQCTQDSATITNSVYSHFVKLLSRIRLEELSNWNISITFFVCLSWAHFLSFFDQPCCAPSHSLRKQDWNLFGNSLGRRSPCYVFCICVLTRNDISEIQNTWVGQSTTVQVTGA